MRIIQKINKVAASVRQLTLIGAAMVGASLVANASETINVGPTIEKAQLETVKVDISAVADAIRKIDPDWVKGLPRLKVINTAMHLGHTATRVSQDSQTEKTDEDLLYWYEVEDGKTVGTYQFHATRTGAIAENFCLPGNATICLYGSEDPNLDEYELDAPPQDRIIMKSN